MRRFLITSHAFTGAAELVFNTEGTLVKIDLSQTNMPKAIVRVFKDKSPAHVDEMEAAYAATHATVVEAEFEATFEMFWHDYPNKRNRHLAEPYWPQMPKTDQVLAFISVKNYRKYCERNKWYNAQIGHTWLKKKEYLNDWNKL